MTMTTRRCVRCSEGWRYVAAMVCMVSAGGAFNPTHAAWTVTNLHPLGAELSGLYGVENGRATGRAMFNGVQHAVVWDIRSRTLVSLSPMGAGWGSAANIGDGDIVGTVQLDGVYGAALWTGVDRTFVNLHPAGAMHSQVIGVRAGSQVGFVDNHASLWSGTADSWVDLHPTTVPGIVTSVARGVENGRQVGGVGFSNDSSLAGFWRGSAATWVSLNPRGSSSSFAHGVHGGQVVGYARIGTWTHAGIWRETADSWVDVHPPSATYSFGYGVHDGWQVGNASVPTGGPEVATLRASVWHGTAGSWEDLSLPLAAAYPDVRWLGSTAFAAWNDGSTLYVAGSAYNYTLGRQEAMLWSRPIPAPGVWGGVVCAVVAGVRRSRRNVR